jgi:hypothetical protein
MMRHGITQNPFFMNYVRMVRTIQTHTTATPMVASSRTTEPKSPFGTLYIYIVQYVLELKNLNRNKESLPLIRTNPRDTVINVGNQ